VTPPPPHDIVAAVRDELAVPGRYHLGTVRAANEPWWVKIWEWIGDRLSDIFRAVFSHSNVGPGAINAVGDLLIAAALLAITIIGARLLVSWEASRRRSSSAVPLGGSRSAHALMAAASNAAAAGAYARAVRLVFSAAVTLLDLRGVIADEPSATVNQLRRALATRDPRAGEPFLRIARLYTAAAYAERPAGDEAWQAARGAYDALVAAIAP
jgi:hypothetical protein